LGLDWALEFWALGFETYLLNFFGKKRRNIKFKPQTMIVLQNNGIIPLMSRFWLKIISISQTIAIFIIKENNPKVIILKGREIIFKTGFIKKFTIPKAQPIIRRVFISPEKYTPGTNLLARKIPNDPAITFNSSLMSIFAVLDITFRVSFI